MDRFGFFCPNAMCGRWIPRHEGYLAKIEREEREKALKGERNDQPQPEGSSWVKSSCF